MKDDNQMKCRKCGGEGYIKVVDHNTTCGSVICPDCNGTGKNPENIPVCLNCGVYYRDCKCGNYIATLSYSGGKNPEEEVFKPCRVCYGEKEISDLYNGGCKRCPHCKGTGKEPEKDNRLLEVAEEIGFNKGYKSRDKEVTESNSLRDKAINKYSDQVDKYCNLVEQNIELKERLKGL